MGMCSEPKQPDNNPGMIAAAQANERIAREQMDMGKEQFEWSKQNAAADRAMLQPIFDQQMRIADSQETRSQEQYDFWKQHYQPLEQKITDEALRFNTDAERERMAGQAGADVEQAYAAQRAQNARDLSRYGINPNSSTALRAAGTLGDEEALAKAGAMNQSRQQAKAMGMAMAADAANMGRGLSGQSNSAAALALQAGQAGQGNVSNQTQNAVASRGLGNANFGMAIQGNQSAGNLYNSDFATRMQGFGTQAQMSNQRMSTVGSLAGMGMAMMRDGGSTGPGSVGHLSSVAKSRKAGLVRGPGGPVDDQIEARLSNGEFVIPEDVVRKKGQEFFEKLVQKYHTPAAQQRARGV
jgi:hypothetical protein